MSNFGSTACDCHRKIENFDEKFLEHVKEVMDVIVRARDDHDFCAMSALLVIDAARLLLIDFANILPGEQVTSAQDTMRNIADIGDSINWGDKNALH